ncbi:MAG: GvpL/GvpF family gas vesicle protein [Pseudomonadota bacterium]
MGLIQLHGLVPAQTKQKPEPASHRLLDCGALGALVSTLADRNDIENPSPEALVKWADAHNAILLAYCADGTVLPTAMGAVFSSERSLQQMLQNEAATHLRSLDRLRNIQEYTVQLHVLGPEPTAPVTAPTGRAFLDARRDQRNQRQNHKADQIALANELLCHLQECCLQVSGTTQRKHGRLVDSAVLVKKSHLERLRNLAQTFHNAAQSLDLDLVITGPWPPYSYDLTADLLPECCHDG